jgi:hypothetical protein
MAKIVRCRADRHIEPTANPSNRPVLDLLMPWDGCLPHVRRIEPYVVLAAVVMQDASVAAEMAF